MVDREHEEWLENRNARRAEAKRNAAKPPVPPKSTVERKKEEPIDDQEERAQRGEA